MDYTLMDLQNGVALALAVVGIFATRYYAKRQEQKEARGLSDARAKSLNDYAASMARRVVADLLAGNQPVLSVDRIQMILAGHLRRDLGEVPPPTEAEVAGVVQLSVAIIEHEEFIRTDAKQQAIDLLMPLHAAVTAIDAPVSGPGPKAEQVLSRVSTHTALDESPKKWDRRDRVARTVSAVVFDGTLLATSYSGEIAASSVPGTLGLAALLMLFVLSGSEEPILQTRRFAGLRIVQRVFGLLAGLGFITAILLSMSEVPIEEAPRFQFVWRLMIAAWVNAQLLTILLALSAERTSASSPTV